MTLEIKNLSNSDIIRFRKQLNAELSARRKKDGHDKAVELVDRFIEQTGYDIRSKSRKQPLVTYRHLMVEHLFKNFEISKKQIGKIFRTGHDTVIYILNTVQDRRDTNDIRLTEAEAYMHEAINGKNSQLRVSVESN